MSNILDTAEKETIRAEILSLCGMADPDGASTKVVMSALKKSGYTVTETELERQAAYLVEKGLLRMERLDNERLRLHRKVLHLTAAGCDYLEGNGGSIAGIGES